MGRGPQVPRDVLRAERACLKCRLIKTYQEFDKTGCENCPSLNMDHDDDLIVSCTSRNFSGGLIAMVDPTTSWAAEFLGMNKYVPGYYAVEVKEENVNPPKQAIKKLAKQVQNAKEDPVNPPKQEFKKLAKQTKEDPINPPKQEVKKLTKQVQNTKEDPVNPPKQEVKKLVKQVQNAKEDNVNPPKQEVKKSAKQAKEDKHPTKQLAKAKQALSPKRIIKKKT